MAKTGDETLKALRDKGFQVEFRSHAQAILTVDFPEAVEELEAVLSGLSIPIEEIVGSGGGEAKGTQRLRHALHDLEWPKSTFRIEKAINGVARESISHEIDHVRTMDNGGVIALEIEWNNKDPFFDRDLENFKRLHAEGAISVGIILTRGASLQQNLPDLLARFAQEQQLSSVDDLLTLGLTPTRRQQEDIARRMKSGNLAFAEAWPLTFFHDKFGTATTHWTKLEDRISRGVGNPCPLLLIGIPDSVITFDDSIDIAEVAAQADD